MFVFSQNLRCHKRYHLERGIVKQTFSGVRGFCDMAIAGVETKCSRGTRSCDTNESVNAGEVENETRRDGVKVVKIRIGSGNEKKN